MEFNDLFFQGEKIAFPEQSFLGDGVIAIGGDFSPYRLLLAYSNGIFPWPDDTIYWFRPEERMVLFPDKYNTSKSFRSFLSKQIFELRIDTQFKTVMKNCATVKRKEEGGTWIWPEMIEAYGYLHQLGLAHSFECYKNNQLVGGLYGVSLGRSFFGESMFSLVSNASKFALYHLVQFALRNTFQFIDIQVYNPHFEQFGAQVISEHHFSELLKINLQQESLQGKWTDLYHM